MLSDLAIARSATLKPLDEVAGSMGIDPRFLEPYGESVAKIKLDAIEDLVAAVLKPSRPAPARKLTALWVPSQNGLIADLPHRHSAIVCRPGSISDPSWSTSRKSPRTISGPSR